MNSPAKRRLVRDFKKICEDPAPGVRGCPKTDNILSWDAMIFGPEDTVWEGGIFLLSMTFSEDYPNKPPCVKFLTEVFHPNVYKDGNICIDILNSQWNPMYDVNAILTCLQSLLNDPNSNSPANNLASQLYVNDRRDYDRHVRKQVEKSWLEFKD